MFIKIEKLFDYIGEVFESKKMNIWLSTYLVLLFVGTLFLALLKNIGVVFDIKILDKITFFSAITLSFNALLFYELMGLVFVIPNSIANSIGKQFEILSLTLLRTSFEEFAHFDFSKGFAQQWQKLSIMAADGASALIIFGLTYFYYYFQKHRQITEELTEKERFVRTKKVISFFVMIAFIIIGLYDIKHFFSTYHFTQSFQLFYTILIFADMIFMLIALRYVVHYPNIFRYSAFVLITIFIRFSLMAPAYYNGLLGILTVVFGIAVVYVHNLFFEGNYFETKKTVKI